MFSNFDFDFHIMLFFSSVILGIKLENETSPVLNNNSSPEFSRDDDCRSSLSDVTSCGEDEQVQLKR